MGGQLTRGAKIGGGFIRFYRPIFYFQESQVPVVTLWYLQSHDFFGEKRKAKEWKVVAARQGPVHTALDDSRLGLIIQLRLPENSHTKSVTKQDSAAKAPHTFSSN